MSKRGETTEMQTEIHFRNLGTDKVKTITVPTTKAEAAIDMIRRSDTLEFTAAYPIED